MCAKILKLSNIQIICPQDTEYETIALEHNLEKCIEKKSLE